jgi:hypothetical protein
VRFAFRPNSRPNAPSRNFRFPSLQKRYTGPFWTPE